MEETAEGLLGFGEALWWQGEMASAIEYRERAYTAFRRRPEPARAARVALQLDVETPASA